MSQPGMLDPRKQFSSSLVFDRETQHHGWLWLLQGLGFRLAHGGACIMFCYDHKMGAALRFWFLWDMASLTRCVSLPSCKVLVQEVLAFTVVILIASPRCMMTSTDWLPYFNIIFRMIHGMPASYTSAFESFPSPFQHDIRNWVRYRYIFAKHYGLRMHVELKYISMHLLLHLHNLGSTEWTMMWWAYGQENNSHGNSQAGACLE